MASVMVGTQVMAKVMALEPLFKLVLVDMVEGEAFLLTVGSPSWDKNQGCQLDLTYCR